MATPSKASTAAPRLSEVSLSDPRWLAFTASHPEALCFHRPAWAELLADCYGYRPFVLALLGEEQGNILGGLPVLETRRLGRRRWLALPFSDYCPPLIDKGIEIDPAAFTKELERVRRQAQIRSFEVRAPLSGPGAHRHGDAVSHRTALERDPDAVFARFHRSQVQRNVRRAEREGVVVRRAESAADLTRSFYELQLQTRRRLGMPMQPRRFFEALWSHLLEPEHGFLLLAYAGSEPVAGAVFLAGSSTLTYKYGASDAAFWRLRPNHLLFWTAIQTACEQGYAWLDFGRTDLPDRGLREFKSGWDAREEELAYTTLTERAPQPSSGRGFAGARALIRRSPAWVSRLSGELLYRHAA
jgi:CelD/BcsL family acetyltransferase involved in cellulose biosynthesis